MYKKTKFIPPILMLSAGAVSIILMYMARRDIKSLLTVLLAVLVIFYILGCVLKFIIDTIREANEKDIAEEGVVIEKDADGEESQE